MKKDKKLESLHYQLFQFGLKINSTICGGAVKIKPYKCFDIVTGTIIIDAPPPVNS